MTTIIGYGEDSLTLWALSQRMPEILRTLGDATPPSDAVVFFRPSCGRGGPIGEDGLRSLFGEFDAIIGTLSAVYLVEAKWHQSGEVRDGLVDLADRQLVRHRIFASYLALWREASSGDKESWESFVRFAGARFKVLHSGWRLAYSDVSTRNLTYMLERLSSCGNDTRDVLLFVGAVGMPVPRAVPANFTLVSLAYVPLQGGDFIDTVISVG